MITPQPGGPALYAQIAARLRRQILSGHFKPGLPLPSERTLGEEYGVARETVRKALAVLRSEGLLEPDRGHAARVREQPERADLTLPEGVPVFWVVQPDGTSAIYPADRFELKLS